MFAHHVTKELSAYCHGELTAEKSRRLAEHLIACNSCRHSFEEIKLGVRLAESLPQFSAPDSLWPELETALESREPQPAKQAAQRRAWSSPKFRFAAVAAVVLLAAGLGIVYFYQREARPSWEVARLNGTPRIGSARMDEKGRLAVGQWLETDGNSRAQIAVGSIGEVDIDPNTRVRLVGTKPTEHRLELQHGKMSARIWAPPRLFFVDTPSAVAADLGCAYTLEVDDSGRGLLHVTMGWVALQLKDRKSMVPAGATCETRLGVGPGTPYFEDASNTFRVALSKFDFEPEDTSWSTVPTLDVLLGQARARDSLTLWHLLARVPVADRGRVYDRLAALAPPPAGVNREGVLQLDPQMLERWKDQLGSTWSNQSRLHKAWIEIWTRVAGEANGFAGKK